MDKKENITPEKLNAEMVEAVRGKMAPGNAATRLSDVLSIGKEAIYRRFRGEVPFTFAEAVLLSRELGISLDALGGILLREDTHFDLELYDEEDPQNIYYSTVEYYIKLFGNMADRQGAELWDSSSRLPVITMMQYPGLSKFHLFKWLYRHQENDLTSMSGMFDSIELSSKLHDRHNELVNIMQSIGKTVFIWDNRIFSSIVQDILYFRDMGIIDKKIVLLLADELDALVDDLVEITARGAYPNGNKVKMYVSNMNIDNSYAYIDSGNLKMSIIKAYDHNTLTSMDRRVFHSLSKWIHSLRKFSVLISQSGEMCRFRYFKTQREIIDTLRDKK